jgi:hypothetical protein
VAAQSGSLLVIQRICRRALTNPIESFGFCDPGWYCDVALRIGSRAPQKRLHGDPFIGFARGETRSHRRPEPTNLRSASWSGLSTGDGGGSRPQTRSRTPPAYPCRTTIKVRSTHGYRYPGVTRGTRGRFEGAKALD